MLAQVTLDEHGLKQLTPVAGEDGSGGSGTLEDADFPVGYVYTQFPQQSAPADLGLPGTWTEITSNYAGRFFRAEGGNAAAFGCCQAESNKWTNSCSCKCTDTNSNSIPLHRHAYSRDPGPSNCIHYWPYLSYGCHKSTNCYFYNQTSYVAEEVFGIACIGGSYYMAHLPIHLTSLDGNCSGHRHQVTLSSSYSETRPINYSIRIWKRTA